MHTSHQLWLDFSEKRAMSMGDIAGLTFRQMAAPVALGAAGGYLTGKDGGNPLPGMMGGFLAGIPLSHMWVMSHLRSGSKNQHAELSRKKNLSETDRNSLEYLNHSRDEWDTKRAHTAGELWHKQAVFGAMARAGMGALRSVGPALGRQLGSFVGKLRGAGAAATAAAPAAAAAPSLMGKAWNMLKHPAVPLAAGVIPAVQGGIQNNMLLAKQKEMMEKGVQDYASGVSTGLAGFHKALAAMPLWQRLMYTASPGGALNSATMRDQMQQFITGMGGQAKALAPGIVDQFYTKASPKGSLMAPTVPAADLTFSYLQQQQEQTRQLQQQLEQRLAEMRQGVGATATAP